MITMLAVLLMVSFTLNLLLLNQYNELFGEYVEKVIVTYDKDKVVEQLVDFRNKEECPKNKAECDDYASCGQCQLSYAIEIVKKGGAK